MEKLKKYEAMILALLEEYARDWNKGDKSIRSQVIADKENNHYQLIRIGWKNDQDYIHNCVFHLEIIDEKVWIQENRTDILIAEELVASGIPKQDIVLGLLPPSLRADSEYAAA